MVVTDSEILSQGEVEQPDENPKNPLLSSLGRQSSIYSLTLDEFQHTLCESGKNFGSMNMDEFLTSIWNAEENQATATSSNHDKINNISIGRGNQGFNDVSGGIRGISKQPSLSRQGSLTLPAPLCRKTVDEVWSEIHREQQQPGHGHGSSSNGDHNMQNPESAPRQPTFGEMTLEDFLIKAGVVSEHRSAPSLPSQQQPPFGLYQAANDTNSSAIGTGFVSRPVLGMACGGGGGGGYQTVTPQGAGPVGQTSGRNGGFTSQMGAAAAAAAVAPGSVYGRRVGSGSGGYAPNSMGVVGQVSSGSSDAIVSNNVDNAGNQFGLDIGGLRGRKRIIDGPVEKVVERRQRRMIKNRESAARSRARKQAYTVELEAELNQLKEENKQLRHALEELERKRKQQHVDDLRIKTQTRAQKAKDKLRMMRRNLSCPL